MIVMNSNHVYKRERVHLQQIQTDIRVILTRVIWLIQNVLKQ